jgi:BirA family biotin operon repressor/biotin-[acetyl-CoA-carboxylase] ligase
MASQMGALSLAIGVAARRALATQNITGLQLKWPNDLVTPAGKVGGILIEIRTESAGPVHAVVGMGLNMALGPILRERIDASGNHPVDVYSLALPGEIPKRNALVATLLDHGVAAMRQFSQEGFRPFRDEYLAADALLNRPVNIQGSGPVTSGIARGVDEDGALRVESTGVIHRIIAGEVSVRAQQA